MRKKAVSPLITERKIIKDMIKDYEKKEKEIKDKKSKLIKSLEEVENSLQTIKASEGKSFEMSNSIIEEALSNESEHEILGRDVHKVLQLLRKKGKLSFALINKLFGKDYETIAEWAETLENEGFAKIKKPLICSPYLAIAE